MPSLFRRDDVLMNMSPDATSCVAVQPGQTRHIVSLGIPACVTSPQPADLHMCTRTCPRYPTSCGTQGHTGMGMGDPLSAGRAGMASMEDALITRAEALRVEETARLDPRTQAKHGQFFTPERAAVLIAGLPRLPDRGVLRVLDPGAGSGMLTAALVERAVAEAPGLQLDVLAVEVDAEVMPSLEATARLCEDWAQSHGVTVRVVTRCADLIETSTGLDAVPEDDFDLVVMNPPYGKLATSSAARRALASLGWESPNLYAAFLALGVEALHEGGQLVAITPRSFANGPYFSAFRRRLLDMVSIDRLHTFESRSTVFADTAVLQENLVFSATRSGTRGKVHVTASKDHTDLASDYFVAYDDLVLPNDPNGFLRVVTNAEDTAVAERMAALPAALPALGVQVSTGRVVDFRARENLSDEPSPSDYPLVYPGNLRRGGVEWPLPIRKAQGFHLVTETDRKALMPSGCYVVVKRFSAKEERRRIVAALWDPERNGGQDIAFENHLNVFHSRGRGLDRTLAWGLCLWLNGTLVDRFFRTFSGHTQVNASDLRSLRFPDQVTLRTLALATDTLPEQESLDALIDREVRQPVAA